MFKRDVAAAMGNGLTSAVEAPEEAVAVLREALEDGEALVGDHAAWTVTAVS